jgi:hypothetical protein
VGPLSASGRARLLNVAKERRKDFTLTLMHYAAERFLYCLSKSRHRDNFVLKGPCCSPYASGNSLDLHGTSISPVARSNRVAVRHRDEGDSRPPLSPWPLFTGQTGF